MHELSVAQRLVDRAASVARQHDAPTVEGMTLAVGQATHLNPDQLRFCVETVATDPPLSDATVSIERVPVGGECECGWEGEPETLPDALTYVPDPNCPDCGARITITQGRGCQLRRLDIPEPSEDRPAQRPDPQ